MEVLIRQATEKDFPKIWEIFHSIVKEGDTYTFSPDISFEEAKKYWMNPAVFTYVATLNDEIVGTYIIKPNHPGLGSHVANASYMVHPGHQGKKIGYKMGLHSLEEAKRLGFKAMQFNIVVATNEKAVSLWKKLGFEIVGKLPKVFNHKKLGLVDAFVMHRFLE
ncbi:MAG: GNAT family N-acetyltransferase [Chlamydiae bacterium]|nr:GNAT family N-acetyltransferase [Chlamydiota bacterium]